MTEAEQMLKKIFKIADELDVRAEDANAHDFVETHQALAHLCVGTIGVHPTLELFTALRKEKGLPGLTGVCGMGPKGRKTFIERMQKAGVWRQI